MPVLAYTHDEPLSRSGKPVFKIQVPNPYFTGKRKGVPFFEGVGRTESPRRAKFFAETLGYDVILPTGYEDSDFSFATAKAVPHEDDREEFIVEEDPEVSEDEEDDD